MQRYITIISCALLMFAAVNRVAANAESLQASLLAVPVRAPASGAYRSAGRTIYVGIDGEPPDRPTIEYYDSKTRRTGTLEYISGQTYRSDGAPPLRFTLGSPSPAVREKPFIIGGTGERLGASLWYGPNARHRSTILLIQGADDSTRQMGFLIPYFVAHGLNVITYDQRGTGESVGNWRYTSPQSKADDLVAMLGAVRTDPAVDGHRIGAWAASNGGWVAPVVATRFPLAFLILKSAPSETIMDNVLYEVKSDLREGGRFSPEQLSHALKFERTMFEALRTNSNWSGAAQALAKAKGQPWFSYMRIPPGMTAPPPPPMLAALRSSLIYDPTTTLERVAIPTLALFGTLDKNVDAADSAVRFRQAFKKSGLTDLSIVRFPGAGHLLVASTSGYEDKPSLPVRFIGYPEAMIRWLDARGFTSR